MRKRNPKKAKYNKHIILLLSAIVIGFLGAWWIVTSQITNYINSPQDVFHNAFISTEQERSNDELIKEQLETLQNVKEMMASLQEKEIVFSGQTIEQPSQTTIFFTDPEKAKDIIDTADTTYYSEIEAVFSQENAKKEIDKISSGMEEITQQLAELDKKYWDKDPQYLEARQEILRVINAINTTKDTLSTEIKQIYFFQNDISSSVEQVRQIRESLDETKKYIAQFSQFMYKIQNEFYQKNWDIDEVKLFIKSDKTISDQLSNTAFIEKIMMQMNDLMGVLSYQEKATIAQIKASNKSRTNARELIANYQNELKNLQEKRDFLSNYLTLYDSNKEKMSKELAYLFSTQSDLLDDISDTVAQVVNAKFDSASFDVVSKLEQLETTKAYASRDEKAAHFSRPLYPINSISKYFWDKEYEENYNTSFNAIEIPAQQNTPLYAVDEGLVYKIANKKELGMNRVLLIHKWWFMTIYLYPNDLLITEGDIVRRWQIIGFSGWEPGTKWAGFVTGEPNLSFMVVDNGKFVDPLDYLDLSVLSDTITLPTKYKFKYLKDKYNLPRELYSIEPVEWSTLESRRKKFLESYGVGVYRQPTFREDAAHGTNIDVDVGICIAFAESTLGRHLTTANNIGNVGNNDRWDRVAYQNPLVGAKLIYNTLNNVYLWHYNILLDYNGYGNPQGKNYATSRYNWQNNVTKCLTMIKGYYVPDDYPVRIAPNPNQYNNISASDSIE